MQHFIEGVTVTEGFLPHFCDEFRGRFRSVPLFCNAISDMFTVALGRMLLEKGRIGEDVQVARYASDEALEYLREATREVEGLKQALLQEALGFAPPGTIEAVFDETAGEGAFRRWLSAFQGEDSGALRTQ